MRSRVAFLGVDIGTSESKGVLVDQDGRILAESRRAHTPSVPAPGRMEHDPLGVWWEGFCTAARELSRAARANEVRIGGIGVSGIGPCVLPLGSHGQPLRDAILYGVDARATRQIVQMRAALGDAEVLERGGSELSSQSAGPKILWIEQEEPGVFAQTRLFVTCSTFITGRLTGRFVIDHGTAAYYHPLYDRRTGSWRLDGYPGSLEIEQLPSIAWAGEIVGTVRPRAAAETGLEAGTPVLVGGADSPLEALAAGVVSPGPMMLMYGSSHFALALQPTRAPAPGLWSAPYLWPGTALLAGGTATAGSYLRWIRDELLLDAGKGFDDLVALAAGSPPGARGVVALPYLSGERTPLYEPSARGVLFGLSIAHTRSDVARAAVEAVAQSAAAMLRVLESSSGAPTTVRAVGGGTRNPLWLQTVSDMTGWRQEVIRTPGAAYGGAMLAAHAVTGRPIDELAETWVEVESTVEPEPALAAAYDRQRRVFDALFVATRPLLAELEGMR